MNKLLIGALALSLVAGSAAVAQPRGYNEAWHGGQNDNSPHRGWGQDRGANNQWRRGQRMGYNDWNSARPVGDYRAHNRRRPGRGYEWRESNGQYVLGAVATGLIVSTIINSGR